MPNQFLSDEFGDIEDYFVTDYRLIDNFVGDTLWVWGFNIDGQLGNNQSGTPATRGAPVTTFAGGTNWKSVSTGGRQGGGPTAAIKTDGSLWTWGRNNNGQLGTNNTTARSTPVTTFAGGNDWKQISCGYEHVSAIKTDGTLWIWGNGGQGRLGTNDTTNRATPVTTFAGGNNWKSVACGPNHSAAIKTDGSLWTWGWNNSGQLGTNDGTQRNTPVTTFAGGNNWKSVASGGYGNQFAHTVALKTDGSLWTWGFNSQGQLGVNDTNNRTTPVTTFAGGNNWKSVDCGDRHVVALKTDGSLWTWGRNNSGQLGTNNTTARSTPVTTFAGGTNWKQISCGANIAAAIKTDGTLWTWGEGFHGQVGNNAFADKSTPVTTFAGGNNWKLVSGGGFQTMAIKSGLNVDLS